MSILLLCVYTMYDIFMWYVIMDGMGYNIEILISFGGGAGTK